MDSSTLAKLKEQYKKDVKRKKNQKRRCKHNFRTVGNGRQSEVVVLALPDIREFKLRVHTSNDKHRAKKNITLQGNKE